VTVLHIVGVLGSVLLGTAIARALRDNLGVHRAPKGTRLRANLLDLALGVVGAALLVVVFVVAP